MSEEKKEEVMVETKVFFNTVGQGKVIHILFERDQEEKTGTSIFELACNKKEIIADTITDPVLDVSHVNCKNCMKTPYYKEHYVEKKATAKENAKGLAKKRKDDVKEKVEKKKEKNLREDEVLIFCAMNIHGEPLTSVMAPDIDLAKQKIIEELEKDKRKMRAWNKGGKTVVSKRIPKHQMDDFYFGLIKEFREVNISILSGISAMVKQLNLISSLLAAPLEAKQAKPSPKRGSSRKLVSRRRKQGKKSKRQVVKRNRG